MMRLLDHRVLVVLGKGGVGKSVVSGALGLRAADRGLQTIIAELNGAETMSAIFDLRHMRDTSSPRLRILLGERDFPYLRAQTEAVLDTLRALGHPPDFHRLPGYSHADMDHLETLLKRAQKYRFRVIATDGVFSMDGDVAPLDEICEMADRYDAIVMVDDSHATGFFGATGRGSIEYCNVMGRVQIVASTFGKALGGASGGFTAAANEVTSLLRQRSRPYLFSNSLSPVIAAATLKAVDLITRSPELVKKLRSNTAYFREKITSAGFDIRLGDHPIIPIILGDERLAGQMAAKMLDEGIYVVGFSYPVVPRGEARIRVQISAAHETQDLDRAVTAFQKVGGELGIL